LRLDFNVLWVDDQPDRVAAQISAIKKRMEQEGFLFNPTLCQSTEDVRNVISSDVFTDEVDLILVDWDLGNGVVGQDAIAQIRETVRYKDVVFYSAQTAPEELRKLAFDKGLEGVYCANRTQLVEEVMGVFESLVKKVLDLDHTRGIVMGATSDIDHIVNKCLTTVHGKLNDEGKAQMFKDALGYVQTRINELVKKAKELEGSTTLDAFFEAHVILTANDRLRILGGLLKGRDFESQRSYRQAIVAYQQQVVRDRNRLGHMVLVPEGKPQSVVDFEGKPVTLQDTRELRRLILGLRSEFRGLLDALNAMDATTDSGVVPKVAE
jgi:hypothetical protein